jgi:hypothetical protein
VIDNPAKCVPDFVVVFSPVIDDAFCFSQTSEPILVKAVVTEITVASAAQCYQTTKQNWPVELKMSIGSMVRTSLKEQSC